MFIILLKGIFNKSDLKENQVVFEFKKKKSENSEKEQDLKKEDEDGIIIEEDFLIRMRHFMSSEIRYSVFRIMLSPLMIFTNFHKIPINFIDFGESVQIPKNFYIELELDFIKNKVSNSFLNIEAVLKKDKYFAKNFDHYSQNPSMLKNKNIYTIIDEDEEKEVEKEVKIENNLKNDQIDKLLDEDSESDTDEDSEDEDYFKKLEEQAEDI